MQVVTIQSRQFLKLPQEMQDYLFTPGNFTEMWPSGPDSVNNVGPRNIRIAYIEDRLEGDLRVLRFRQSRPVRVAGFNYGRFKKLERADSDSGMTVSVYTNPGTPDFIRELNMIMQNNRQGLTHVPIDIEGFADAAMADSINMGRVGSIFFGPLPEKRIAITQQTQAFFGQSWPSLVYLPFLAALDGTVRRELGLRGASHFVDEVTPHEVAHRLARFFVPVE